MNSEVPGASNKKRLTLNLEHIRLGLIAIMLLLILGVAGVWVLSGIQAQVTDRLATAMRTVLNTTDKSLRNWAQQTEIDVAVLTDREDLRANVKEQLRVSRSPRFLRSTRALNDIRRILSPAIKPRLFPGFVIIAPDGVQIAAETDDNIGPTEIAEHTAGLLERVMAGMPVLGLPFESRVFVDRATLHGKALMTASAPLRDEDGKAIAGLTFQIDPRGEFTQTARLSRLGTTGETYAFDRSARLLTESRFDDELHRAGLLPVQEEGILITEIRDPGGNTAEGLQANAPRNQQPLTHMAQSAIHGEADRKSTRL